MAGERHVEGTVPYGANVVSPGLDSVVVQDTRTVGDEQGIFWNRGKEVLIAVRVQDVVMVRAVPVVDEGEAELVQVHVMLIKQGLRWYWLPW